MYKGYTISAIIPCYNEEEGIKKVLRDMPSFVDEVVVVDNNSTDNTGKVAKSLGAKVVFEPKRGYGSAYRFRWRSGGILCVGHPLCDFEGQHRKTRDVGSGLKHLGWDRTGKDVGERR